MIASGDRQPACPEENSLLPLHHVAWRVDKGSLTGAAERSPCHISLGSCLVRRLDLEKDGGFEEACISAALYSS